MLFAVDGVGVLERAADQVPALAVLAFIVIVFLKQLREIDANRQKMDEARSKTLENLGTGCHAFQERIANKVDQTFEKVVTALDANTRQLSSNSEVLHEAVHILSQIDSDMKPGVRLRNETPR